MQQTPHCKSCHSELVRRSGPRYLWSCQNSGCRAFDRPIRLTVTHAVRHGRPANPGAVAAYYDFVADK